MTRLETNLHMEQAIKTLRRAVQAQPRLPSARPARISGNDNRNMGVRANRRMATSEIAAANKITPAFRPRPRRKGMPSITLGGMSVVMSCITQAADALPSAADGYQYERLGDELRDQTAARCSQGTADGQLSPAAL
jgi:hypothetical protein